MLTGTVLEFFKVFLQGRNYNIGLYLGVHKKGAILRSGNLTPPSAIVTKTKVNQLPLLLLATGSSITILYIYTIYYCCRNPAESVADSCG